MADEASGLPPHGWVYKGMKSARLQNLMSQKPLGAIVEEILENAVISRANPKAPCEESKKFGILAHRVEFELTSRHPGCANAMDQLLNGAFGVRARYAVDADEGSNATGRVCRIIAEAIRTGQLPFSDDFAHLECALRENIEPSLSQPSAKVWFGESPDRAGASPEELECTVWIRSRSADQTGIQEALSCNGYEFTSQDFEYRIGKGRTVPTTKSIGIKGAWVTDNGVPYVTLNKRTRARQIHLLGWS